MKRAVTWQKIGLSVLCVFLALMLIAMIFVTAYVHHLMDLVQKPQGGTTLGTLSPEDIATATFDDVDPTYTGPTGNPDDYTLDILPTTTIPDVDLDNEVVNILLIGQDRRKSQTRQRSDVMMLCTFNTVKNTITMTSFLRDTWVYIPGYGNQKLNTAYFYGGYSLLNETLAVNFGVHVDAYVEVDFFGFRKIIDLLGGVEINLTQKEADYMNSKKGFEYNKNEVWNLKAGKNILDGDQALAYSRIRKIDSDFSRTNRQRTVIKALITAYKNRSLTEMLGLVDDILPLVTTNMTDHEILTYVVALFPMLATAEIDTLQIPANGTFVDEYFLGTGSSLIPDLPANRKILEELFKTK